MNYYSISQLINFFALMFLGLFVLFYDYRNRINQTYALVNFSLAFWGLFYVFWLNSSDYNTAFLYLKILMMFAVTIPATFLHFVFNFLNIKKYRSIILPINYCLAIICIYFVWGNLLFTIMRPKMAFIYWPDAGKYFNFYMAYFYLGVIIAFYLLINSYLKASKTDQNKLFYFIIALILVTISGSLSHFLWYNINIPPFLNPLISIYAVIVAYAILKHHLMDINIVIRKGLIYSVLLGVITGMYIAFLNLSNNMIVGNTIIIPFHIPATAIPPLLSSLAFIIIGLFVLLKSKKKQIGIPFFYMCLFTFWWQFGMFLMFILHNAQLAAIIAKAIYSGIIFIPIAFTQFLLNFVDYHNKRGLIRIFYLIGFVFLGLLWATNKFISGYYIYSWGYYPRADYLHFIYLICLLIINSIGVYIAARKYYKTKEAYTRKQYQFLFIAFCFYMIASVDFLINYGVVFYPPGYLFIMSSLFILVYAIFKYSLFEFVTAIKKGIFYSSIIGLVTGIYVASIYLFGYLIKNVSQSFSIIFASLLMIVFAVIFQPLRDKIQEFIDKVFFRGKYDYQKTLKELSLVARSIAGLDELLDKILTAIVGVIKLNNASIYVLDKRAGRYFVRKSIGVDVKRASIPETAPLIKQLSSKKEAVMYDEIAKTSQDISLFMKDISAAVIIPVIAKNELVGFLCLGEKLSGEVYSDEDIDLLTTLCSQMAVSIENAMLYEDALEAQKKLYQADKLATVGALAAGLAHEIKNPIAAIKGFSQVIGKAVTENDAEAIKDFKDVVPRQLDRINDIVEKLLTLSRPPKLEKRKININGLLDEIVKLVEKQALQQKVEIVKSFDDIPQTLADPEQLTQAFLNLVLNAMQSMPDGGQIEIRTRFMGTDRIVIEFIDNGVGIPKDRLSRIFDPFYTTKAGGSGLGLSVTQKIIIDHQGRIEVESEVGKGTQFRINLPVVD